MTALILFELVLSRRGTKPMIDLRLFRNHTFALSFGMMFILGVGLYGTTILIPQLLQSLLGYTATDAGVPFLGGVATLVTMPLIAFLIARVNARYLLAFGFFITAIALFHMMSIHLDMKRRLGRAAALFTGFWSGSPVHSNFRHFLMKGSAWNRMEMLRVLRISPGMWVDRSAQHSLRPYLPDSRKSIRAI